MPIPVTTPDREPTVATVVALLVHKPPGMQSVSVSVAPTHTPAEPPMGQGERLTVTAVVVKQPVGKVYVVVVVPVAIPVTMPVEDPIVATVGVLLAQVPPPGSVNIIVAPTQRADGPPIGEGSGLITITAVPVMVREQPVIAFVATTV